MLLGFGNGKIGRLQVVRAFSAQHSGKCSITRFDSGQRIADFDLLEIVNHHSLTNALKNSLYEIHMHRMHLVIILSLLAWEHQVESDLISLVHDRTMAADH